MAIRWSGIELIGVSVGVCVLAMAAGSAWGQVDPADVPAPTADPAPAVEPSVEPFESGIGSLEDEWARELGADDLTTPVVEPTLEPESVPVAPSEGIRPEDLPSLLADDGAVRPRLLREGSFLVRERASVLRAPTGEWVAVFHTARGVPRGRTELAADDPALRLPPAMVLLPSPTLDRLETLVSSGGLGVAYRLTGEVFRYRDRNYLFPTAFAREALPETQPEPEPVTPEPAVVSGADESEGDGSAAQGSIDVDDPSVDELLADLTARDQTPRGLTRPEPIAAPTEAGGAEGAGEPRAATPTFAGGIRPAIARDGDLLVRRRGRMVRMGGGEWAFVVDSDTDRTGPALGDTPLVLLPCRTLRRMERAVGERGDGVAFELTGRLTSYAGRAYVLPSLAIRMPESSLNALQ